MTKKKFVSSSLNRHIRKSENFQHAQQRNFSLLCEHYRLRPWQIGSSKGKWRELCLAMMEHLIPGFSVSRSGNKAKVGYKDDYEIAQFIDMHCDFASLDKNGKERDDRLPLKQGHALAAKEFGITPEQARAAYNRDSKRASERPDVFFRGAKAPSHWREDADPKWKNRHRRRK